MSFDYLLMTASPVGTEDGAMAFADFDPGCLLRADSTGTMVVLVRPSDGGDEEPLLWISPSQLMQDWNEVLRLLPEGPQPPSRHLVYWTELHSPSSMPEIAERVAHSLAAAMGGWTIPFSGRQE